MKEELEKYIEYLYGEEKNNPMYAPEVAQSRIDFIAGSKAGEPKWNKVEEVLPQDDRVLIIKTFDYRRPKENVIDVTLGYFENGIWFYDSGGVVNDGNGWHIIQWMKIPQ